MTTRSSASGAPPGTRNGFPATVVFILEELNFGGTQRQTLELAARLDRQRFQPEIWTLCGGEPDFFRWAAERGLEVAPLTRHGRFRPHAALPALWARLGRQRPALVHLCTALPNIWGRVFGALRRLPAIIAACRSGTAVRNQHERILWRLAHAHICNSRPLHEMLTRRLRIPAHRVVYIPNGVDTDFFRPGPDEDAPPEILCIGRMVPDKDHATLLEAFSLVLRTIPEARLNLVGNGPLAQSVRTTAGRPDLAGKVTFHAGSADLRDLMARSGVFTLASVNEGMPNVILEAMACGLPVVATRAGGIPDMVEHGVTGLLAPNRDPRRLADALIAVLSDRMQGRRMGMSGRERVLALHSFEAMVSGHQTLYDQVLRGARR